eukprot:6504910-Alexandrium_andersonii.AAC.1
MARTGFPADTACASHGAELGVVATVAEGSAGGHREGVGEVTHKGGWGVLVVGEATLSAFVLRLDK